MAATRSTKVSDVHEEQIVSPNWTRSGAHGHTELARPLSDIREITEPSLLDGIIEKVRTTAQRSPSLGRQSSLKRKASTSRKNLTKTINSVKIIDPKSEEARKERRSTTDSTDTFAEAAFEASSIYSIPSTSVPPRASSRSKPPTRLVHPRQSSPKSTNTLRVLPDRPRSPSLQKPIELREDTNTTETSTTQTTSDYLLRSSHPREILEYPLCRHARIALEIQMVAPLFVGGGSVEGQIRIAIDDIEKPKRKLADMLVSQISVDLLGVEELVSQNRKAVFLSLNTELIDADHPPSSQMTSSNPVPRTHPPLWTLKPSKTTIPFKLHLPLDVGPSPFHSKSAQIRYLLSAAMRINDAGKHYTVRCTQEVTLLSTYDPEKALRSLPSPLTAFDEIAMPKAGGLERIKLTARLYRQVWVSGTSMFVDVHIVNESRKALKKLELCIERDILCYKHTAAATLERSASHARLFQEKEQAMLSKTSLKTGTHGWNGVKPHSVIARTCEVDISKGHATIKCGKYFEVRFYLNITIGTSHTKLISVQLPVILIHMNSVDILPNAVNQVALAIEQRRNQHHEPDKRQTSDAQRRKTDSLARSKSTHSVRHRRRSSEEVPKLQGRAFAAARHQSLERMRAQAAELDTLTSILEHSPRKYKPSTIARAHSEERHRRTHNSHRTHKGSYKSSPRSAAQGHGISTSSSSPSLVSNSNPSSPQTPRPGTSHTVRRAQSVRSIDSARSRGAKTTAPTAIASLSPLSSARRRAKSRQRGKTTTSTAHHHSREGSRGGESLLDYYFDGTADGKPLPVRGGGGGDDRGRTRERLTVAAAAADNDDDDQYVPARASERGKKQAKTQLGLTDIQPVMLGLGRSNHVDAEDARFEGVRSTTPIPLRAGHSRSPMRLGHSQIRDVAGSRARAAADGGVIRRASLKLKESIERIDRSRFEFRAVGAGRSSSNNNRRRRNEDSSRRPGEDSSDGYGSVGFGDGLRAIGGWLRRGASRTRDLGGRAGESSGWI